MYAMAKLALAVLLVAPVVGHTLIPAQIHEGAKLPLNGEVEVANFPCDETGEFPPAWAKKLTFAEAPQILCVKWSGKGTTVWANWEIYKVTSGPDEKVASGPVPAATLAGPVSRFQIGLQPPLPRFNTAGGEQRYRVVVRAKKTQTGNFLTSLPAFLIHQPQPGPANPYACSTGPARKVRLEIPQMTVNQTSSTKGDGDRDELYIKISRLGPGPQSKEVRLPYRAEDYYEAKNGKTVHENGWTNRDEERVNNPQIWNGTLKHGETILISVTAMEQDNADLKDIKGGIVAAMSAVASAAAATGTPQGAVVAAVAGAVAGGTEAFVPDTDSHDFVGFVAVRVENRCGYVQTVWTTYSSTETEEGVVTNNFLEVGNLQQLESRLAVFDLQPNTFWPNGVDWSPYTRLNSSDQFWWRAGGTHDSKYTFLLKTKVAPAS